MYYTVCDPEETAASIAIKLKCGVEELAAANLGAFRNPSDLLFAGMTLRVPLSRSPASSGLKVINNNNSSSNCSSGNASFVNNGGKEAPPARPHPPALIGLTPSLSVPVHSNSVNTALPKTVSATSSLEHNSSLMHESPHHSRSSVNNYQRAQSLSQLPAFVSSDDNESGGRVPNRKTDASINNHAHANNSGAGGIFDRMFRAVTSFVTSVNAAAAESPVSQPAPAAWDAKVDISTGGRRKPVDECIQTVETEEFPPLKTRSTVDDSKRREAEKAGDTSNNEEKDKLQKDDENGVEIEGSTEIAEHTIGNWVVLVTDGSNPRSEGAVLPSQSHFEKFALDRGAADPPCICLLDKKQLLLKYRNNRGDMVVPSTMLRRCELHSLVGMLPARFRFRPWELVFSTEAHGYSLGTLARRCEAFPHGVPVVMLIMSTQGVIFGAYFNSAPHQTQKIHFEGRGESFVFSLGSVSGRFVKCGVTHRNDYYYMLSTSELCVGAGGAGSAITFGKDLEGGKTSISETYHQQRHGPLAYDWEAAEGDAFKEKLQDDYTNAIGNYNLTREPPQSVEYTISRIEMYALTDRDVLLQPLDIEAAMQEDRRAGEQPVYSSSPVNVHVPNDGNSQTFLGGPCACVRHHHACDLLDKFVKRAHEARDERTFA